MARPNRNDLIAIIAVAFLFAMLAYLGMTLMRASERIALLWIPNAVVAALQQGAAGSWPLSHRSSAMLEGKYPLGFRLDLHHKDLRIALSSGRDVGLEMPVTDLVQQLEAELISRGYGNEDVSTLRRFYDGRS